MPNWCNNSITISGPTETIKAIWEQATDESNPETGLLDAMCPMPKELHETTKGSNGDDINWYDWRVSNWGTKWEVSSEGLEFTDNGDGTAEITGWFDSAWAPPIGAYEKFADMMDNCDIQASYHEPGMDFAGFWSTADGDEYCENLREEYELPEDERSDLYIRLDDEYNLSEQFAEWDDMEMEDDEA